METVRIRDPGWKKVGYGINIPDPGCIGDWYDSFVTLHKKEKMGLSASKI